MMRSIYQHLISVFTQSPFRLLFATSLLICGFTIMSILFLLQKNIGLISDSWSKEMEIVASIAESATESDINALQLTLEKNKDIESFKFVSKEENLNLFKSNFPELVQNQNEIEILSQTLTPTFKVKVKDISTLESTSEFLKNQNAVEVASYGSSTAETLISYVGIFRNFSFGAIGLFSLFGFVMVQLAIFMSVYSKKQVIEIFNLLGTPSQVIRTPFGVEGGLLCLVACGAGLVLGQASLNLASEFLQSTALGSTFQNLAVGFNGVEVSVALIASLIIGFFLGKKSTQLVLKEET